VWSRASRVNHPRCSSPKVRRAARDGNTLIVKRRTNAITALPCRAVEGVFPPVCSTSYRSARGPRWWRTRGGQDRSSAASTPRGDERAGATLKPLTLELAQERLSLRGPAAEVATCGAA